MNIKKFYTAIAMILAGSMALAQQAAQTAPDPQPAANVNVRTPDPHRQVIRLAKELNLTADQVSKLEPMVADRDQKLAALRSNTTLAPAAAQKQMRAIQKSSREQMSTILTPGQIEQFKSLQKTRAAQYRSAGVAANPAG